MRICEQALKDLMRHCETAIEIIADSYGYDPKEEDMAYDCQAVNVLQKGLKEAREALPGEALRRLIVGLLTSEHGLDHVAYARLVAAVRTFDPLFPGAGLAEPLDLVDATDGVFYIPEYAAAQLTERKEDADVPEPDRS